jgi:hypothetical protein
VLVRKPEINLIISGGIVRRESPPTRKEDPYEAAIILTLATVSQLG